jgi:hypothetical protein
MWKCIMSGSLALCHGLLPVAASDHASVSAYNVVWDSPSKDFNGSMPLGNGDIGANVWVGQEGEIHLLISKTDSWGGCGRLLKVGKVRVRCEPALVSPGSSFLQTLDNPHFPALRSSPRLRQAGRSGPLALSGASRRKQTPSNRLWRLHPLHFRLKFAHERSATPIAIAAVHDAKGAPANSSRHETPCCARALADHGHGGE